MSDDVVLVPSANDLGVGHDRGVVGVFPETPHQGQVDEVRDEESVGVTPGGTNNFLRQEGKLLVQFPSDKDLGVVESPHALAGVVPAGVCEFVEVGVRVEVAHLAVDRFLQPVDLLELIVVAACEAHAADGCLGGELRADARSASLAAPVTRGGLLDENDLVTKIAVSVSFLGKIPGSDCTGCTGANHCHDRARILCLHCPFLLRDVVVRDLVDRDDLGVIADARLDLHMSRGSPPSDDDLVGNAPEVGVLEGHRGLDVIPVVVEHGDALFFELLVELSGFVLAVVVERDDHGPVRRKRRRPDDPVVIVVLFDDRCDDAGDTDTVAAHEEGLTIALFVHERCTHGLGVFGAELEDVADLDATSDLKVTLPTMGASVAGLRVVQVVVLCGLLEQEPIDHLTKVDVQPVVVEEVAAAEDVGHPLDALVVENATAGDLDGTSEAHGGSGDLDHDVVGGEVDRHTTDNVADLDHVEFQIAAHAHGDRERLLPHSGHADDGLDHLGGGHGEVLLELFDRTDVRRVLEVGFAGGATVDAIRDQADSLFLVGAILTLVAREQPVPPGLGDRHELVAATAADGTGVRIDFCERESTTHEDGFVGLLHDFVGLPHAFPIPVE